MRQPTKRDITILQVDTCRQRGQHDESQRLRSDQRPHRCFRIALGRNLRRPVLPVLRDGSCSSVRDAVQIVRTSISGPAAHVSRTMN